MEQWAEIRRLHRAEGVPIKEISRRLGIARNTVRSAVAATEPPKYQRAARGSIADDFEPEIRKLLREYPRMPATVIAERIGWTNSISTLKNRGALIRPEYTSVDPRTGWSTNQVTLRKWTSGSPSRVFPSGTGNR